MWASRPTCTIACDRGSGAPNGGECTWRSEFWGGRGTSWASAITAGLRCRDHESGRTENSCQSDTGIWGSVLKIKEGLLHNRCVSALNEHEVAWECQARRLPLAKLKALKEELLRLLELEVIEPSFSSWASPVVLVTKKDGSIRLCVDFRKVNNLTIKDSYPLPRMDDSIDALSGSKWFSTLDLSSGYWQVKMDPKDTEKTTFATPFGLYQFKVMPFGLANAPATFERLMERVLAGLHWETCLIYIDDIIAFSKTFDEHVDRLTQVLQILRAANLKLASHKCKLFRSRVEFLGHVVSDRGVETDPKKIEAISGWPEPKTVKEVRSFIGLSSYYRRFVKDFAKLARPLHRLTEKDTSFEWTTECQEAFNSLKAALASPPILGYPLVDGLFTLDTDASLDGIGAVLSQEQDGVEKVIAYYTRALTHTERKYCVTRRELLAVVESVKHFHHCLYGRHFVIRTDHGSLRWLLNFKNPEDQMARWLEDLFVLDFEIQHRPGRQHGNADGLSKRPCTECRYCERQEVKNREPPQGCPGHRLCSVTKSDTPQEEGTWLQSWTPEQLAEWQQNDVDLKKVHMWMEAGWNHHGRISVTRAHSSEHIGLHLNNSSLRMASFTTLSLGASIWTTDW